ncbi:response regulator [Steroidobacter cummioxidans]|uniref:response regulator n=1 Tax=Steroidobacter cummioxidans TaxID=1803913 RepID=UPI000E31FE2B|nr:response regulator [Steroidobacter cummioxidans]
MKPPTQGAGPGPMKDETDIKFLIEKSTDGIIVVDAEGVVLSANPAAEHIFGRPAQALIGTHIGIPPSEEHLRHATKMEAVGRLTAGIAHDFNNLLTVVLGNLDGAQRLLKEADAAVQRSIANAIHGARRAAVLTERLLAFSQRKPLEPSVLDVSALIERLADLLRRSLGENIQVKTVQRERLWSVEVDATELETSILNLAVNARDAMPQGGELSIETMNLEVDAAAARAGDVAPGRYVCIQVTDNGAGMSPATLKLAFEPFFSTKSSQGGTGLGLSQVYGFVRQSGGRVELASEPAKGTSVRVLLPAAVAGASNLRRDGSDAPSDPIARGSQDQIILVVEDHTEVRAYAVASLTGLGYGVIEAADAVAALQILEREPAIAMLFTDLGLPGRVDGRMLAEQARKLRPTLPVLITSGYANDILKANGRPGDTFELLNKPFTLPALAKRVHELLMQPAKRPDETSDACMLVIEDEPLVRMYVTDILADGGLQTEAAETFAAALETLSTRGERLSGAIVDLTLPDRSGAQIVSEIRRLQPQLPIVVATGRATAELRRQFQQDARLRVLSKPFDRSELIDELRALGVPYEQAD